MLMFDDPGGVAPPQARYSQVAVVDLGSARLIVPAGQVPVAADNQLVGAGDFTAQARQAFDNVIGILAAHGASVTDIVKTTYYVTDMAHRPDLAEVRQEKLGGHLPTSTLLEVAGLANPDHMIEIDVIAVVSA
jgi:enamine deaminase RidA (YjgF/YER057c/UK114 family)